MAEPLRSELPAPSDEERVPNSTIVIYSLPQLGVGATFFMIGLYYMKFATDELAIGPGVMGVIFGLSRIWDAISDPIVGYLSDRTQARMGRRRVWMLASIPALVVFTIMMWSPPVWLEGPALILWVSVSLFLSYTAVTIYGIPHEALGAELAKSYHGRTPIFGLRHVVGMGGFVLGAGGLYLLETSGDRRDTAFMLAVAGTLGSALLIGVCVALIRERPEYQGRGGTELIQSMRDVFANPHARLLLVVFFIENIGSAVLMVLLPFFTAYVMLAEAEGFTAQILLVYAVPSVLAVPIWVWLARRVGKKPLWVFSMAMLTFAFSGMFFAGPGDTLLIYVLALAAGVGGGCGAVVGPSIQADVIDWDELQTGQRKEGAYFAVWNFVRKSATGVTAMIAGLALEASGFEPNAEQTETAKLTIRGLMAFFPGICFAIGTLLFLRFRLNQAEHDEIRAALDARRS